MHITNDCKSINDKITTKLNNLFFFFHFCIRERDWINGNKK